MKILFSFESHAIPVRAVTLINWLVNRGHSVDILYDDVICDKSINGSHYLKNAQIYSNIDDFNEYDIWFADLLSQNKQNEKSSYLYELMEYKNILCIISFDDSSSFSDHRLDECVHEKVHCWLNNLIENDRDVYHRTIRNKCMLIPSFIESSNFNYNDLVNILNIPVKKFMDKKDMLYFSGTITGGFPVIDCRITTITKAIQSGIPFHIRVVGTDPAPFLKYMYDYCLDSSLKRPHTDKIAFLNELNDHKFILSPKGNGQNTRRHYEAFAFNNLAFINENNNVEHLFNGIPNVHYVSYKIDASDLKEKLLYYASNLDAAQKIADNGTEYWETNCKINQDGSLSDSLTKHLIDHFRYITNINL
jgi:hypothetical protein